LRKHYDTRQNRYATTWAELMVACEACHGPGAAHVAWAQARPPDAPHAQTGTAGLQVRLGRGAGSCTTRSVALRRGADRRARRLQWRYVSAATPGGAPLWTPTPLATPSLIRTCQPSSTPHSTTPMARSWARSMSMDRSSRAVCF